MSSNNLDEFVSTLLKENISSNADVDAIIGRFAEEPGSAQLDEFRDLIDAAFSENTIEDIFDHLSIIDHNWAKETLAVLKKMSPISLKIIIEQLKRGAKLDFDDCMKIVEALSENYNVALLNSKNAWRILGQESYSYEIAQVFEYDMTDKVVVVPIGNAGNITAVISGFLKFFDTGIINTFGLVPFSNSAFLINTICSIVISFTMSHSPQSFQVMPYHNP
jgi:hypothetical protein